MQEDTTYSASQDEEKEEHPELLHKEGGTTHRSDSPFDVETKCGLTVDDPLKLLHPLESLAEAAVSPQVIARGQRPCPKCMSQHELAEMVQLLLDNPETRLKTLEAMNRACQGEAEIELALTYETCQWRRDIGPLGRRNRVPPAR